MTRFLSILAAVATLMVSGSALAQSKRGASRVDFDDQLIQGQVNKGAVHLIERKDSDLGSLVKTRKTFRKEILAGTEVQAVPMKAAVAIPAGLPVVKPAEVKKGAVEASVPAAKPAAIPAPVKKPATKPTKLPLRAAASANGDARGPQVPESSRGGEPAKKSGSAAKTTPKIGGSGAISRR